MYIFITLILLKRMFGSKKVERAFRENWCQQFPWLHYNIDRNAAFCFMQADNEGKFLGSSIRESSFITDGFTNWKEATCSFRRFMHHNCKLNITLRCMAAIDIEKKFMATPKPDQCGIATASPVIERLTPQK